MALPGIRAIVVNAMTESSTAHDHGPIASAESGGETADAGTRPGPALLRPVEAASFWAGIGLPFLYLPLLFSGPATTPEWAAAVGLLVLHAAALYVGRSHNG